MRSACSLRRGNRSVYIRAVERAHGLRCTCEGGADVCAHARVELIAIPLNRVGMFSKRVHTRTRVEGARGCPLHGLLGKRFRRKPFVQVETFQRAADVARHGLRTVSTHRTHSAENIRQPSQSTVRTRPSKHSLHAHAHTHALTCAATCEDSSLHFRPAHSLRSPRGMGGVPARRARSRSGASHFGCRGRGSFFAVGRPFLQPHASCCGIGRLPRHRRRRMGAGARRGGKESRRRTGKRVEVARAIDNGVASIETPLRGELCCRRHRRDRAAARAGGGRCVARKSQKKKSVTNGPPTNPGLAVPSAHAASRSYRLILQLELELLPVKDQT